MGSLEGLGGPWGVLVLHGRPLGVFGVHGVSLGFFSGGPWEIFVGLGGLEVPGDPQEVTEAPLRSMESRLEGPWWGPRVSVGMICG